MNAPYNPVHRVGTLLINAVHEAYDLWPQIEGEDTIRNMTATAARMLEALVAGDPPKQAALLDALDGLFARIPREEGT